MANKAEKIEIVELHKLVPNPKNPNKHPQDQIERLAKLIDYQGFRNPIIVSNRSGFIVVGHGRLEAAKKLGIEQVPVIYQDFDDEAQEYAYVVSDNTIAEWADTDLSMVNTEMLDLGPDFDVDLLGIKDFEIEPIEKYDEEKEDDVPEVPSDPVTKRGDVWILGDHRIMCGDSTSEADYERLCGPIEIDMLFTDPPYGMDYSGRGKETSNKILNDNIDPTEFYNLMPLVSERYIWGRVENYKHLLQEPRDTIIWRKNNFGMGKGYRGQYECCFYYGSFNGSDSDVWDVKKDNKYMHPTQKPVELCERAIKNSNPKTVLDLFLGSGSTLIACEKANRKCYGMELDEKYCDVIVKRWQDYTGKEAVLESTGEKFNNMAAQNG